MSLRDIDSHKLGYHPERIAEWKKGGFCYPLHIEAGRSTKNVYHAHDSRST